VLYVLLKIVRFLRELRNISGLKTDKECEQFKILYNDKLVIHTGHQILLEQ
jgi:hypothetical protein